jgi:thiol-disulfide isomerase/thioredoxin
MKIILLSLSMILILFAEAQTKQADVMPEVGKPLPEFILHNLNQFKKTTATNNDFKGKWLFMDFWTIRCTSCIHSFPKVNSITQEFSNQLNWVMVGLNGKQRYPGTEEFYEKMRAKRNLQMPYLFDSLLAQQWHVPSFPHIIIVNPKGIVYAITSGRDLDKEKVQQLLAGQQVSFYEKDQLTKKFEPTLNNADIEEISSDKLLLYSMLTEWNGEQQSVGVELDRWAKWPKRSLVKGYGMAMVPLYALYNCAFFGQWDWDADNSMYKTTYPFPILELTDTSRFNYDYTYDVGKGTYNYMLKIPPEQVSKDRIMSLIQDDLKRAFGYRARVETRSMPVWKLIATPEAAQKLITKGGPKYMSPGTHAAGYTFKNVPVSYLVAGIRFYLSDLEKREVFIDDTGITDNIDFSIDADMTNLKDIQKELKKQGFELIRGHKKMNVLVISDQIK